MDLVCAKHESLAATNTVLLMVSQFHFIVHFKIAILKAFLPDLFAITVFLNLF